MNSKAQDELLKDPAFKRYAVGIDRALAGFDAIVEWPDYIQFLGRLLKALQAYPSCRVIPSKLVISNRLAQCLNPGLPSGVHQKTLEVYSFIFSQIGQTGLSDDLKVWLPGLLPLFKYASLVQKSHFLTLFETFIIPLGPSFRPAQKSIILALLPGLEEEHGEYFEKTLFVLDQIRVAVKEEEGFFWQCLWLAIATSAEQRVGACNYCLKRMESLGKKESAESIYASPDPGLFIRALCAGLTDSHLLVQRGFLELLLKNIPLSLSFLQNSPDDLQRLLLSAISVVLRRDMSLNRRLYAWLLGPESTSTYFTTHALTPLSQALKKLLIPNDTLPPDPARVCRISLALLDKWEIGGHISPQIFTSVIESIIQKRDSSVLSSARALFDSMDPAVIWSELFEWVEGKRVDLLNWTINNFNLREEEMLVRHIPQVLLYILCRLRKGELHGMEWFVICGKLVALLPSRAFTSAKGIELGTVEGSDDRLTSFVREYYRKIRDNAGVDAPLPDSINGTYFHEYLLRIFVSLGDKGIQISPEAKLHWAVLLRDASTIVPPLKGIDFTSTLESLHSCLLENGTFQLLRTIIELVVNLTQYRHMDKELFQPADAGDLEAIVTSSISSTFIRLLWRNLAPDRAAFHVEAVSYIWTLTALLSATTVEDLLAFEVQSSSKTEDEQSQTCAKFSVLWKHAVDRTGTAAVLTKSMMLILRFLKGEESSAGRTGVERWLASLGSSAHRMFDIIFSRLLEDPLLRLPVQREYKDIIALVTPASSESDDLTSLSYHLDLLLEILKFGNQNLRIVCAEDKAVLDPSRLELLEKNGLTSMDMTYAFILARICLRALFVELRNNSQHTTELRQLHLVSLRVLEKMISFAPSILSGETQIGLTLLKKLYMSVEESSQYIQPRLMEVLLLIFRRDGSLRSLSPNSPNAKASQGLARQRSISGKKSHIKGSVEDLLGPVSLLLHTILDALSFEGSRPIVTSWSNFFLDCLPYFSDSVFPILIPTVECVVREINKCLDELHMLFSSSSTGGEDLLDQNVTLLTLLEGVLFRAHEILRAKEARLGGSKGSYDGTGFLNNVMSGVWGGEGAQGKSTVANNRLTVLLCVHDVVKLCYKTWSWDALTGSQETSGSKQSREYTCVILKDTARRILQKIHAAEKLECFEALLELWQDDGPQGSDTSTTESIFGLLQILNGYKDSAIFSMFMDSLASRTNPSSVESAKRSSLSTNLSPSTLLPPLIAFIQKMALSSVSEVNKDCMTFLKDCTSNVATYKNLYGVILKFATVYGEKLDDSVIADKKRMRKDFGDLYLKLLTLAISQNAHRRAASSESSRISLYETDGGTGSEESMPKPGTPDISSDGFLSPTLPNRPMIGQGETSRENFRLLIDFVIPKLPATLEAEKMLAACNLIMNLIIGPALRKRMPQSLETDVLDMLVEIVKVPGSHKSWRREIYDYFNENVFFEMSSEYAQRWTTIMRMFMMNDKDRAADFISRISAATSSILRSSMDQDRLFHVKRLAFIIISGDLDQFVTHISAIKEKLAELGRTASIDPIHGEVCLLFRALLLRFSPVHLISFWPMMITEIQSLFTQVSEQSSIVSKEQLPLLFEACKLLDMLLVVNSEDFQLQEWVFITDTIEAVYRSPNSQTYALIDRLALRLGGVTPTGSRNNSFSGDDLFSKTTGSYLGRPDYRALRHPIITAKRCETISDLIPFLSHLSLIAYESTYALSGPADMAACDKQILDDIFRDS